MKKLFLILACLAVCMISSCNKFDDSEIWDTLNDHEGRISALEELCQQMNSNISSLQAIVDAFAKNLSITNIAPIEKDGKVLGYTITFSNAESITIFHGEDAGESSDGVDGEDGADGHTPVIGVKKDADNIYYWTIDGEWMLDADGQKIKAIASDGVTPRLKIENDYWYVSYDGGESWEELGKAVSDTEGVFSSITQDERYVYFNLAEGEVIVLPKQDKKNIVFEDLYVKSICCKKWDTDNDGELSYAEAAAVTTIGSTFKGNTKIIAFTELKYFTGITYLYESAFDGCTSLWKIVIPENVSEIRKSAFNGCSSLSSINIPVKVTKIADNAFYNCTSLKAIYLPKNITSLGKSVFYGCSGVLSVACNIPDSFSQNSSGSNYSYTSSYHWLYSSKFSSIKIENTVTEIGGYAFKDLPSTTALEVAADNTVTSIGQYAFYGCVGLTSIPMNSCLKSIGTYAFYGCAGLLEVVLPDSLTSLGSYTFYNCAGLNKVVIGKKITTIESYTFYSCPGLLSITIPESVTSIGSYAFYNCTGLNSITIPDSVEKIEKQAFYGCVGVTTLTLGSSVGYIADNAFWSCSNLKTIYCKPNMPPDIYYYSSSNASFPFNSGMTIYVPRNSFGLYMQYDTYSSNSVSEKNWYKYESYIQQYDFV